MRKKDVYKLTNPQTSIWNMENFFEGTTINNICTTGTIYEKIDLPLLKQAINNVVEKNDSFRLQIHLEDNIPYQTVTEFKPFDIDVIYVKDESEVKKIEQEMVNYKFNIINSVLFYFKIVVFGDGFCSIILNLSHLIADSWSLGLTIQGIIKEYHALKNNEILPESNNSYIDYIKSEEAYKKSEKYKNDKKYWEEVFSTIPEQATIPSVKKNRSNISYKAKRQSFSLSNNLVKKINDFCKKEKLSVFNFLMAIYSIYIGRVSNLDDFVIGTPILNRTNFRDKHTTGMFVNTVPIRVSIPENNNFVEFVHNIASNVMSTLKHQKYSYNTILNDLRAKNKNIPNLYNIIISYQITKAFDENLGNYKGNWVFNNYCGNDFNIHISDVNDTGELIFNYDYLIGKYSLSDVKNLHARILAIIDQILETSTISVNNIQIVTEEEKNKILYDFNNTTVEYPKDKTIVDLFEEQVEKTPDNIAVVCNGKSLTYKELNEKANSLAHCLIKNGIKENCIVGILLNRSIEIIVSILGVLKSGSAYIPMDPDYPKDRISYMLKDSNCSFILSTEALYSNLKLATPLIDVSLNNSNIYNKSTGNLNLEIDPESLSYVIYTSGSTGLPKGVMLKHKGTTNLTNFCNNYVEYLKSNKYRSIASVTTISFDIFFFESIISLQKGLRLVIASQEEQTIPRLLGALIEKENIEIIQTTPSRMKLLIDNINNSSIIEKLKYITLAGEQYPIELAHKLKKLGAKTLYNGYGPSETTVFSTLTDVTDVKQMTIGKPLDNTKIYIVDSNLNLLPVGIPGEICISGAGVGNGYIGKEDLNKKSFIKNPFNDDILYKTGDLGFYNEDGTITCLGRLDNQVKIRGLRIELEEIEKSILKIKEISDCVVVKRQDSNNHEFLCAYYVKNLPIDPREIRKKIQKNLTNYMVPQYFIELKKLPYTPNGKIDRKSLPAPKVQDNVDIIKPRNKTEEKLKLIFEKVLGQSNISIDSNFFELGGDSLSAIELSTKIFKKFNTQISIKTIFEKPNIIELANIIDNLKLKDSQNKISKARKMDYYPLSSAQKRIYYTSKMIGENNVVYNITGGIIVDSVLDKNKVEECFNEIIRKQSSFRTSFEWINNDVYQKVNPNVNISIPVFKNRFYEINSIIDRFAKPFNLETAPLIRIELHIIDNRKTIILIDSHHIILDGTSLNILINDFCKLYNNKNVDTLKIEYKDFAVWENNYIESKLIKKSEKYWLDKFKDIEIPSLHLPYDFNIPSIRSYEGNTLSNIIDPYIFKECVDYAKAAGISPYVFFISALFVLMYKYTGQREIFIGSPSIGRMDPELENVIGMFVNNIVIDANIDSDLTFDEFANIIKSQVIEGLNYQDFPYDLLVRDLNYNNSDSSNPLFDVMFTYQTANKEDLVLNNKPVKILNANSKTSKFNLSIEINPLTRVINLEYRTDLFKRQTIKNLYEHYINILKSIIGSNKIAIKDICITSEKEKSIIMNKFNNTNLKYPIDYTLISLFNKNLKKNSRHIAVIQDNIRLTYKELDEKSNYLANKLYNKGVSKGSCVGVCLHRSPELIVSIWAILKLGAIYMPIYPNYPKDRIYYMLANSNSNILITNSDLCKSLNYLGEVEIIDSISDINSNSSLNFDIEVIPSDIAYIIYTSGSTGKPKGVQITHSNLINFVFAFKKYYKNRLNKHDSLLATTNISFDVSIFELFLPILCGAKLVLYTEDIIQNIFTFCNSIIKYGITTLYIPPNILNETYQILKELDNIKINKILVGVEPITRQTLDKYLKLNPQMQIINGYGPTETTICCSALDYTKDHSLDDIVSIGHPLYNNKLYILDKDQNIQPIGIIGELYVTGKGVGSGYLNNTLETNKNYLDNIFDDTSSKMYKTGDLAKWNTDGTINFIGRNDSQIKINGHRIEMQEINNVIMQFPGITKSFCMIQSRGSNQYIVSYFVAETTVKTKDLISFLKTQLANYMIPSFFMQLPNFPLTPNGKIDKNNLPTSFLKKTKTYIAPRNELERQIINIWKNLFLLDKIGIDDNFFDLGGDSLIAIKFQIEAMNIGLNITYSDIFTYSTPRELSERNLNTSSKELASNTSYNFNKINELLKFNDIKNLQNINLVPNKPIGNILLLGATGFVGAHILDSYLSTQKGIVYCLVRKKSMVSSEDRLRKTLNFYFGNKYNDYFGKRIIIITGDITNSNFDLPHDVIDNISSVVHSAALVKHYGSYEQFNDVNIIGTKNVISICKKYNKKLYYISTISVSGNILSESENTEYTSFTEQNLYIGQDLNNLYIYTKFEAEKLIYNEILKGNLSACVFRLGNITNRFSDGKFQINTSENAFVNRLKSIIKLGIIQEKYLSNYIEFTPVDYCANAIIKIISSNPTFSTFHLYNNNFMQMQKLFDILKVSNLQIKSVSDDEFALTINKFLNDKDLKNDISGIITDLDSNKLLNLTHHVVPNSDFTNTYLSLLNFKWPNITNTYIKKYIKYFKDIKYLE